VEKLLTFIDIFINFLLLSFVVVNMWRKEIADNAT